MNSENLYLFIINNLCDGVYFVDKERRITFWNKAAEDITGYSKNDIIGELCYDNLLSHIDKEGRSLCTTGCPLHASIIDGQQRKAEIFVRHKDGHRLPLLINVFPMVENGETIGAIEIFTQKSPIVYDDNLIESLSNMAMNDQLTKLANRRKVESFLEFKLNEMKRFQNKFCVVFLDIDNFRNFNNTYGHDLGDEVLKRLAQSISHTVRKTDLFGRWGGEEFIGIFEIKTDNEALLLAEKVRALIEKTEIPYKDDKLSVTASMGVTIAFDSDNIDSVIKRADALMYKSKQNGKNRVSIDTI